MALTYRTPSGVSRTGRLALSKRETVRKFSAWVTRWLTADWVTFNSSAALEKLPSRAVASTAKSVFRGGTNFQYFINISYAHVYVNGFGIVLRPNCND